MNFPVDDPRPAILAILHDCTASQFLQSKNQHLLHYPFINMCQQQKPTTTTPAAVMPLDLKKQVRFGEIQQHFLAPLPQDLQRQHMYYSHGELQVQKEADMQTLGECDESFEQGICFRGLETPDHKTERRNRIKKCIRTVLEVHLEQKELGYLDDYELYIVARANSKSDRKKAQKAAAQDALELPETEA